MLLLPVHERTCDCIPHAQCFEQLQSNPPPSPLAGSTPACDEGVALQHELLINGSGGKSAGIFTAEYLSMLLLCHTFGHYKSK